MERGRLSGAATVCCNDERGHTFPQGKQRGPHLEALAAEVAQEGLQQILVPRPLQARPQVLADLIVKLQESRQRSHQKLTKTAPSEELPWRKMARTSSQA